MTPPNNYEKPENKYHKDGEMQAATPENDPSHRPSSRPIFESLEAAEPGAASATKGAGSIPLTGNSRSNMRSLRSSEGARTPTTARPVR